MVYLFSLMLTKPRPDIFAIGFQEIVPLTAQQIVQADPEKKCVRVLSFCEPIAEDVAGVYGRRKS